MRRQNTGLRLWGWPISLALLTALGLLASLIGDGLFWQMLSWAAMAILLAVIIRYGAAALIAPILGTAASASVVAAVGGRAPINRMGTHEKAPGPVPLAIRGADDGGHIALKHLNSHGA